ncbi:hypothetical protein E5288_WYG021612 [Bos mutus]|uniref:Glutamate-rich protein 1 n=1 Tax=Bos mutus TaxID=72004 RepID=A0A6B0RWL0_9CETA|nr:hypothetical protein [Bos mutus]
MAALRRHVFVGKVLKKLYPEVSHSQEKKAPVTPASRNPPEKGAPEREKGQSVPPETGGDTRVQPTRRLYTVGLPPEGWVPTLPEPLSCSSSESSSSSEDTGDQDLHNLPKRRRIRKHKSKKKFKNPNNIHVEPAELEKQQTGSLTGASGVHFMYQPEETSSEQEDVRATDGESAGAATGGGAAGAVEERVLPLEEGGVPDAEEEEVKSTNEKADGILNFLKSTLEIYFYDGVSKDSDSGIFMESTKKLFKQLETHSVSPSDVFILDHMKTLLLLHDTKRLKSALDVFPEHCRMPLGIVVCLPEPLKLKGGVEPLDDFSFVYFLNLCWIPVQCKLSGAGADCACVFTAP